MGPHELITQEEGFRSRAYLDHKGILTIGYGRNLEQKGLSREEAWELLKRDVDEAIHWLEIKIPTWRDISENRQAILISMYHQMGPLRLAGFSRMFKALLHEDHEGVFEEMLDSKWAIEDTPDRARRHAYAYLNDLPVVPPGKNPTC